MGNLRKGQPTIGAIGFKIAVGSAIGVLITVALTPIITRQFSPAAFGEFSTLVAVASIAIGLSTLRLEVLAQAEKDDSEYSSAMKAATCANVLASLGVLVATVAAVIVGNAPLAWLLVGPMVLIGTIQLTGSAYWVRKRHYGKLAVGNFWQQGSIGVWQTILGFASPTMGALVVSFMLARAFWVVPTIKSVRKSGGTALSYFKKTWRQAVMAGASAGVNSLAGQALILVVAFAYGVVEVGILALAVRVIVGPVGMAAQAFSSAATGEVGRALREGENYSAWGKVKAGSIANVKIAIIPIAAVGLSSPFLAGVILGAEWQEAGYAIAALSIGALAQFAVSPFAQVLNLSGNSKWLLAWDVARLIALVGAVLVPATLGQAWIVAVTTYSIVQVLVYGSLVYVLKKALCVDRVNPKQGAQASTGINASDSGASRGVGPLGRTRN